LVMAARRWSCALLRITGADRTNEGPAVEQASSGVPGWILVIAAKRRRRAFDGLARQWHWRHGISADEAGGSERVRKRGQDKNQ
jgi:hypothetical protein